MEDLRKSLNQYLFYEFAMDLDEDHSKVSDTWSFELREVGRARDLIVFEFDDDHSYFAIAGPGFNCLPKAGMTFDDLIMQNSGSKWIDARDPIDLSMSMPGDEIVPSGRERRLSLEELGAGTLPGRKIEILEGLFLRTERRYLALFRAVGAPDAVAVGVPSSSSIVVGFPDASAWRRLAWAVGWWIRMSGTST